MNTFIIANSKGVGKGIETCGAPINSTPIFGSEVRINSIREIKSLNSSSISSYISQFTESKRNLCTRLHENNDFDGSFCLYMLDRAKKDEDSSSKHLGKAIDLWHPLALMRPHEIFKDER